MARGRHVGPSLSLGLGRLGSRDRFDRGMAPPSGFYPRRGKGWGQSGEGAYPDLLAKWDKDQRWSAWRQGMRLAYSNLLFDRSQFLPVQVLRLPAFQPQLGWQAAAGLLVAFPSTSSPEGRWTVTVRPRGAEIAPVPVGEHTQSDATLETEAGALRLLVLDLPQSFDRRTTQAAASALIGELVEDSGLDATSVAAEDDEAVILMCLGVYQDDNALVFDGTRCWRRQRLETGRLVLREEPIPPEAPGPRFRPGRHLTQSTTLSCNCPSYLGIEYGRLRGGVRPGSQALFPQTMPASRAATSVRYGDPLDQAMAVDPPAGVADPLEGVARRFGALSWRREPSGDCKHCHAVRFAMGCPVAEPDDYLSLSSDYWDGLRSEQPLEELDMPLAQDRFLAQLRRNMLNDAAYADLGSTITTGSVGDAWGAATELIRLHPRQVDGTHPGNVERRFNAQLVVAEPRAAENALLGDVWAGRLTQTPARPYAGPGELLDAPLYEPGGEPVATPP